MTSLNFSITSGWSGDGVDDAMAQLTALKQQIDDLNSKRLQITADATETQATIADVKKQIDDLNQEIKLGVEDEDAKTKLLELKAELDALNNRALAIKVDKSQADAELAALKLEMDAITKDQKIKVSVDNSTLRDSLDSAKSDMDQATKDMSNDWDGVGKAGRAASLNLWTAVVLLLPAIIPLSEAVLSLGGAIVSAFGGAAVAAGVFGFSVEQTISSAAAYNTSMTTLKGTLLAAQQQLAVTSKTSSSYASDLLAVQQAQAAVNQEMASASPAQRQVASGLQSLTSAWNRFQQAAAAFEAPLIERVMKTMATGLGELLPIIPAVTNALKPLADAFNHFVSGHTDSSGSPLQTFVNWVVQNGIPNLQRLIVFLEDLAVSVGQIGKSFTSQGNGLTAWLDKVGASLDKWGADGGFTRFAASVQKLMPEIVKAIGSLGEGLAHVITALHDFSGTALDQLTIVSQLVARLPIGVIEAFFVAFEAYKVIATATAAFKAMSVVVDALKVAYAATEAVVIGFALGVEGATAAEGDNTAITAAMTVGRAAMAVATGIATAATWLWTAAMTAASAVMEVLLGPIGLIILAVAAVGFGIYELVDHWSTAWGAIKTAFDDAWSALKQGFDDVVSFLQGKWGMFVLAIPVVGWMVYVAANWKSIWGDIQAVFTDVVNALKSTWDTVSQALESAWNAAWSAMKTAALAVWDAVDGAWQTTLNALKAAWDTVSQALESAWNTVWSAMKTAATAVWDAVDEAWQTTLNALKAAWDTVSSAVSGAWDTFWNALSSTAKTVWTDIQNGVGTFASGIESAFTKLVSDVSSIWQGIENVFATPVDFIIRIWNDVAGAIGLPTINTTTASQGASTAEAGTAAGNNAGVHGLATGGLLTGPGGPREDKIPAMLSNGEYVMPAAAVEHYGVGTFDEMRAGHYAGGGLIGDITGFVSGVASGAANVFGDVTNDAIDALKTVAQTAVYDTARPVINGVVSAVPNPIPGVPAPAGSVPHSGMQTLGDEILDKLKSSQSTAQAAAKSVGGTIPTGEHLTLINEALQKVGIPQSQWSIWEAGLNTLITRESAWNPTAINLTDSNAAAGHPSQGLMQCTSLATKILTKRGWLSHDEVRVGDYTIGYNPKTGKSEWTRITKVVHYENAPVWRIGHKGWHADVTPNHRWYSDTERKVVDVPDECPECDYESKAKDAKRGMATHMKRAHGISCDKRTEYQGEFIRTEDFKSRHRVRLAAEAQTEADLEITDEEAAIVAWLQGDGTVAGNGKKDGTIWQAKPAMIAKIRALLKAADYDYTESVRPKRAAHHLEPHVFFLRRADVTDLWARAQLDRLTPEEFILKLSTDQRSAWLSSMIDAEGHTEDNFTRITQIDGLMQDAIRMAVFLSGHRPTYSANSAERLGFQPCGSVGMARPHVSPSSFAEPEVLENQTVWCVKTDLETWTAELDGQVFITGNTIPSTFAEYSLGGSITDPLSNIVAGIRYIEATYGCVPDEGSEILTKRGWKNVDEIEDGDETVGYDPETGESRWTPITAVHRYQDAEVVRLHNSAWSATTTGGHRWWSDSRSEQSVNRDVTECPECGFVGKSSRGVALHRAAKHGVKGAQKREAASVGEFVTTDAIKGQHRIRVSAQQVDDEGLDITEAEAELIGWIVGDGTVRLSNPKVDNGRYRGVLYQAKPRQVEAIRLLLDGAEIPCVERVYAPRQDGYLTRHEFSFGTEYMSSLMARSGYVHNGDTLAFVLSMSSRQRSRWLKGVIGAEGHRSSQGTRGSSGWSITQADGPVCDGMELAAYLEGWQPRRSVLNSGTGGRKPSSTIILAAPHVSGAFLELEELGETTDVWCVTTELGTWTLRQGGHAMLTGNSISAVQQANANLPAKGYDTGGALMPGLTLANNTTGTVEGVLNPTGLSAVGGLGALGALNSGGGFKTAGGSGGGGSTSGGTTVVINAPISINADGADAEQIAALIEAEFEKLATMIESEVGTR